MTRLLETEVDGRRLTDVEARTQLVFLFISGNETTRNLIGNLLWMLASDPELFDAAAAPTASSCPPRSRSRCATTRRSSS